MRDRSAARLPPEPDAQPRTTPHEKPEPPKKSAPTPKLRPTRKDDPMSDAARRSVRIVAQTALGLSASLPLLLDSADIPLAAVGVGTALAVTVGGSRVVQSEQLKERLPKWPRSAFRNPEDTLPREPAPGVGSM
jgi:hypothetical protein